MNRSDCVNEGFSVAHCQAWIRLCAPALRGIAISSNRFENVTACPEP